jgi:acetyl esterase/lipase
MLLKYRVPGTGPHWDVRRHRHVDPKVPRALQDAQRTVGLLRSRAAELKLDPRKIGVLRFSAGGHLAADAVFSRLVG